ncbi:nucleoside-triphosphatase [Paenibacillus taihuensis]|uniref:Nucleoside-triphosphatase n=1 Tax=Paenibacillus taihuensis TaxID=1156355 RepID=A0A3D9S8J4_9BACL|nr:nucleoside-triphosphatase [Paenibacillus taihuensis]REE89035.1 nucleoside-triphosphatase [Paenibacillus taihuensis]
MSNVILITGKPRMGKSTLIKKLVQEIGSDRCGGFYTDEMRNEHNRIGFNCVSVQGDSVGIAHVESTSPIRVGRYGVEAELFERFAGAVLEEAASTQEIILIDEIGFMQMHASTFAPRVQSILTSLATSKLVIGTVPLDSHPDIDPIKQLAGVRIIHLDESNRDAIFGALINEIKLILD